MKSTILKSLLILGVIGATVSCSGKKDAKNENGEGEAATESVAKNIPTVEVATSEERLLTLSGSFTGTVEAYAKNNILPQQPRRISRILVDVGDKVSAGELLVELDRSQLVQAKAQLENAKIEYERSKNLYEFGGASKSEYDSRSLQYEVAKSTYENLLENTTLVAPVAGYVSARNFDEGDMAGSAPILVIEQIRPVKIMINVSECYFSQVKRGMSAFITLDSYGDEVFKGSVSRIVPVIDAATRSFGVEITIPNADERVRPGMFARVTLPYGKATRVVVSDRAVQKLMGSGDRYVYVYNADDNTVHYRKVEIGRHIDTEFEILSGLEAGEQVVVKGLNFLRDGITVKLQ